MLAYPNGGNNFASLGTAVLVVAGCLALPAVPPGAAGAAAAPAGPDLPGLGPPPLPLRDQRPDLALHGPGLLPAGRGRGGRADPPAAGRRRRGPTGWRWRPGRDDGGRDGGQRRLALQELRGRREPPGRRRAGRAGPARATAGSASTAWPSLPATRSADAGALAPADGRGPVQRPGPGPGAGRLDARDAEVDSRPPPGRTWLVVHRSGCPGFDEARLARLKAGPRPTGWGRPAPIAWP